jgi:hypothetical protein
MCAGKDVTSLTAKTPDHRLLLSLCGYLLKKFVPDVYIHLINGVLNDIELDYVLIGFIFVKLCVLDEKLCVFSTSF